MAEDNQNPLHKLLSRFTSAKSSQRIKFGGVVGKVTYIALAAITGGAGVMVYGGFQWPKVVALVTILGFALVTIRMILSYADKHPQSATLEGSEIIAWQQQAIASAAKTIQPPKDSPVVPNPGGPPPQINPPEEAEL